MGGAVAVRAVASGLLSREANGIVVIDVVEGTALEAIEYMDDILSRRPASFLTTEEAVNWVMRSGTIRNRVSAEISVPTQLKKMNSGFYVWRTDLFSSKPYWKEWYEGLSQLFLDKTPKSRLLVLAGTDRLDDLLCGGHMSGKYQLVVLPGCGHSVQEDAPDELSRMLYQFYVRNEFVSNSTANMVLQEKLLLAKMMKPS
jgi:protein phosphatase methylesterase 1